MTAHLFVASRSPRRRELLAQLGLRPAVIDVDLDESPLPDETPDAYVARIADAKVRAGHRLIPGDDRRPVLAADTAVVIDGRILGKPADAREALSMLGRLSGREHRVLTAVALKGRHEQCVTATTRVWFRVIDPAEARAYWASGEPADKAGAYGIQGLGAAFVERIDGSYSGVVGLPLFETATLLAREGLGVMTGGRAGTRTGC